MGIPPLTAAGGLKIAWKWREKKRVVNAFSTFFIPYQKEGTIRVKNEPKLS